MARCASLGIRVRANRAASFKSLYRTRASTACSCAHVAHSRKRTGRDRQWCAENLSL